MNNWRPITLLNTIHKLGSPSIANRFKQVLDSVISQTQTGFLKERFIGENIRFTYDLLNYTENINIPGMLVLIDFEKAFDSVSWNILYETLAFFNFGDSIIQWVKTFNNNIYSYVTQCGHLSQKVNIGISCRQRDPLAAYLFLTVAEIVSILIKNNKQINGIHIGGVEHKISQYAGDTGIILDGSRESFCAAFDTLDTFEKLSGLKINSEKTNIVWIGSKKYSHEVFHHRLKFNWGTTTFNLLGILFSVDLVAIPKLNFTKALKKVENLITSWSRRLLTPKE